MTEAIVTIASPEEGQPKRVVLTHKPGQNTFRIGDVVISHGRHREDPVIVVCPHCDRPPTDLGSVAPGETKVIPELNGVTIEHTPILPHKNGTIFIRKGK